MGERFGFGFRGEELKRQVCMWWWGGEAAWMGVVGDRPPAVLPCGASHVHACVW